VPEAENPAGEQSSAGLWFGTEEGLTRFDGTQFTTKLMANERSERAA